MKATLVVTLSIVGACASPSTSTTITADEWAELEKLSPAPTLPAPPADPSNRVADDPTAAALGQQLFFDPVFSGALLESDNDGQHAGVGLQGETGKVSCASCHLPESGFVDTRTVHGQLSLAAGWTHRRTPSILDVGHVKLLMWDGRFDSLQRQALAVFESPLEANSSRLFFAQQIARHYAEPYRAVFGSDPTVVLGASYPRSDATAAGCSLVLTSSTTPDEECSAGMRSGLPGAADYDTLGDAQKAVITTIVLDAGKAIAAYERLLSCGSSRFDAFMHGDESAMTEAEQRGAALFVGKAKCASCHGGPLLSDHSFHNVGMFPKLVSGAFLRKDDAGAEAGFAKVMADPLNVRGEHSDGDDNRLPTSIEPAMRGAFRTPMLRCVSQRPSFMRDGQLRSLEAVVKFFNEGGHKQRGVDANTAIGYLGETELEPLGLDEQEVADLVSFLEALDGPGPAPALLTK